MNRVAQNTMDAVLDQQKAAWLDGSRPSIDDLVRDSLLPREPDFLLDLIYNEIVVREELGENPSLDEYAARYPHLDQDLKLHFEVHRAVQENLLADTCRPSGAESLADLCEVALEIGPILTDYEIVDELGRGGMGVVYKARHRRLKRFVAIKMFQPGRRPSTRELERFRTEAEAIARLQHPNIVQVFEVGFEHDSPYLAIELVTEGTLQQELVDFTYQPRAAAELVEKLALAIQHSHDHHIIHRDLKPANVLFAADGTPKITDFGLAKILTSEAEESHDATRSGEPIGTPRYMSPEQASGHAALIGPATDMYALGTLLYECMTGQPPFVAASIVETIDRIRHEAPVPPRRLQRAIPRDLETICLACLHKDPARRYPSAQALADDLRRFLNGEAIAARRTPAWERAWMWCRRRPSVATLLAACAILICSGLIFLIVHRRQEQRRVAVLRIEIAALIKEGQGAMLLGDARLAKDRFLLALGKVQAEPALQDSELGLRGWLDHVDRAASDQLRKQRQIPPLYDERRDEAFIVSLLTDPKRADGIDAARKAIAGAIEFTQVDGEVWVRENELLRILDADLVNESDPVHALAILDSDKSVRTRLGLLRRVSILEKLGRKEEVAKERHRADSMAPDIGELLFRGVDCARNGDFDAAIMAFDNILAEQPENFLARILQGICFVKAKRFAEAKVALTACIGQRPRCPWSHVFRGRFHVQSGDLVASAQDFQHARELAPNEMSAREVERAMLALKSEVARVPRVQANAFWNSKILISDGMQEIRNIPAFQVLKNQVEKE